MRLRLQLVLDPGRPGTIFRPMDLRDLHPGLHERVDHFWRRGVRLAARLAIAFGLAAVAAIVIGAAVTDNAFAQIAVTFVAALGLWLPFVMLLGWVDRLIEERRSKRARRQADPISRGANSRGDDQGWRRLTAIVPSEAQRIAAIRRSLEQSRVELGNAKLDPDAHDLCVLIDRRLPQLIDRELENLAPDDPGRDRQLRELVELIEQFARHCSRKRLDEPGTAAYEAAVLRRRFEARLSEF